MLLCYCHVPVATPHGRTARDVSCNVGTAQLRTFWKSNQHVIKRVKLYRNAHQLTSLGEMRDAMNKTMGTGSRGDGYSTFIGSEGGRRATLGTVAVPCPGAVARSS